ncbi:YybH family protein [Microbulbifer sp. 2304DJ12-6]|uniref:YybH family protein n=1 Tax=Microbulbifer sp. 2304DJ12-6 TaxID=3233340 RepID=UPI0039AED7ED
MKTLIATFFITLLVVPLSVLAGDLESELRAADKKSQDMYNAHDAEGYANLFTENAIRLAPDGSRIEGRKAIQEDIQKLFDAGLQNNKLEVLEFGGEGNLAWMNGKYSLDLPNENNELKTYTGNYTLVLKRNKAGEWLIHIDTWNEDPSREE